MHLYLEILVSLIGLFIIFSIINSIVVEWVGDMLNARGRFLKSMIFSFFEPVKKGDLSSTAREIFTLEDRKSETEAFSKAGAQDIGFLKYRYSLVSFLGTMLTGIALSFGSTFWFDLLRQFLKFGKTGI